MTIGWYPGHMHKARKDITTAVKQVDAIVEIVDARLPYASENPMLNKLIGDTPRLRVLNKADLADVRLHDLRHSTASFLVNAGRTLYEVQHILGHTQVKTTQRYAHLSHDTLLAATNSVNTALGGMFTPIVSASPVGQVQLVQ